MLASERWNAEEIVRGDGRCESRRDRDDHRTPWTARLALYAFALVLLCSAARPAFAQTSDGSIPLPTTPARTAINPATNTIYAITGPDDQCNQWSFQFRRQRFRSFLHGADCYRR